MAEQKSEHECVWRFAGTFPEKAGGFKRSPDEYVTILYCEKCSRVIKRYVEPEHRGYAGMGQPPMPPGSYQQNPTWRR